MAVEKALPDSLGKVHPRFLTSHISTILMGVASVVWYVGLRIASENILFDSITALGLMIAFYYGLTGFACALYYRSQFMAGAGRGLEVGAGVLLLLANVLLIVATLAEWKQSVGLLVFGVPFVVGMLMTLVAARSQLKAWFLAGLCPILGGEILTYIFFKSCLDLKDPENLDRRRLLARYRPAARDRSGLPAARGAAHGALVPAQPGVLPASRRGVPRTRAGSRPGDWR